MTSIELLKQIQEEYDWESAIFLKGNFETIKQDLEVLDILKKHLSILKIRDDFWDDDDKEYEIVDIDLLSNEELKIIKDWLKNNGK